MQENKGRNRKIYDSINQGSSYAEMAAEYGVCEHRIKIIYEQVQKKEDKKDDRLYNLLYEFSENEQLSTKACTVLRRAGVDNQTAIVKLDRKQLRKLRGCGAMMEELIMRVIEELRKDESCDKMSEM